MQATLREQIFARTEKSYRLGTHRTRPPAETFERLRPLLPALGITRVANVTGLDRIGVPVYLAVRPNSRGLAVSQGKGLDCESAKVSAIMESLETHHAERPLLRTWIESRDEIQKHAIIVDTDALPKSRGSRFHPSVPIPWVEGYDLITDAPIMVPFEMVHTNETLPRMPGSGCFLHTTNGLASGNALSEAVLHGLCEVVERDAHAMFVSKSTVDRERSRIDLSTISDPLLVDLLARFERANIAVLGWNMTGEIELPSLMAAIFDRETDPFLKPIPVSFGFGCHPDRGIAWSRALTEAAQSRLTGISGSRDDRSNAVYRAEQAIGSIEPYRKLSASTGPFVDFETLPTYSNTTVEADVRLVLDRLQASSRPRAIVVDLSRPDSPVAVVRTIVPGCEGPVGSPSYQPLPTHSTRTRGMR